jgi:hypothetical protein
MDFHCEPADFGGVAVSLRAGEPAPMQQGFAECQGKLKKLFPLGEGL